MSSDLTKDLPMSMIIAAFTGISWYIGVEINTSLFILFKRRGGLYFWSCALASWGVILQPIFIILADFGVWKDAVPSIVMIYLTWFIMVIPQSWVLYSRLHLLMHNDDALRIIKLVLLFNSVVFSVPTIIIGTIAQATTINPSLVSFNLIWDRIQLVVYFVQETTLSILYIFQTQKFLKQRAPLREHRWSSTSTAIGGGHVQTGEQKSVLWHLIYTNILVIALDITLLGIQCADLFNLQGAFKPCVYGIKLKVEFVILNRLLRAVRQPANGNIYTGSEQMEAGQLASDATPNDRDGNSWQQKPNAISSEEDDGIQLVESHIRGAFRTHSGESDSSMYHASIMK